MISLITDVSMPARPCRRIVIAAALVLTGVAGRVEAGRVPDSRQPPAIRLAQAADDAGSAEAPSSDSTHEPDPLFDDEYEKELAKKPSGFPDPLEPVNRVMLSCNRVIDRTILDPITKLYGRIVPERAKPAIRRSFRHFASGSVFLNEILQVHFGRAARTAVRFVVNSTAGLGGLFDVARCNRLRRENADFGQTLFHYGVGSGPYLVLPIFGPSNVRDAFGDLVDGLLHPAVYFLGPAQQLTYGGSYGVAAREEHYQSLKALERSAVDYYAALRNAYYQVRQAQLADGTDKRRNTPSDDDDDIPCTRTLSGGDGHSEEPRGGGWVNPVSRWNRSGTL